MGNTYLTRGATPARDNSRPNAHPTPDSSFGFCFLFNPRPWKLVPYIQTLARNAIQVGFSPRFTASDAPSALSPERGLAPARVYVASRPEGSLATTAPPTLDELFSERCHRASRSYRRFPPALMSSRGSGHRPVAERRRIPAGGHAWSRGRSSSREDGTRSFATAAGKGDFPDGAARLPLHWPCRLPVTSRPRGAGAAGENAVLIGKQVLRSDGSAGVGPAGHTALARACARGPCDRGRPGSRWILSFSSSSRKRSRDGPECKEMAFLPQSPSTR